MMGRGVACLLQAEKASFRLQVEYPSSLARLCLLLWSSRSLPPLMLMLSISPWENSVLSTSTSMSSVGHETSRGSVRVRVSYPGYRHWCSNPELFHWSQNSSAPPYLSVSPTVCQSLIGSSRITGHDKNRKVHLNIPLQ